MTVHRGGNLSYERSDAFALAYCCMVCCYDWSYHCRWSRHSALYAFVWCCVCMCSLIKFVANTW